MNVPMESHVFRRLVFISFVYFSEEKKFIFDFRRFCFIIVGVLVSSDAAVSEALLFVSPTLRGWLVLLLTDAVVFSG